MTLTLIAIQCTIILFIGTTLAIVAIGIRVWSRHIMKVSLAFNDYMAFAAVLLTIGFSVVNFVEIFTGGVGVHVKDIMETSPWVLDLYIKLFSAAQLLWASANTCVKLSILSLYTVIFPNTKFIYICYGTMAVTLCYFTSVLVETFALCHPVQYNWDKSITGECEGQSLAFLVAGITNLIIDVFIVALPMPMLFGLRLPLLKRVGIAAMFSLGALICVLSLLRILWLATWDLEDLTYGVGPGTIYSALEPALGVVNACLPIMTPAITRVFGVNILSRIGSRLSSLKQFSLSRSQDRRARAGVTSTQNEGFQQLVDETPLNGISPNNRFTPHDEEEGNIVVTTEWQVVSFRQ